MGIPLTATCSSCRRELLTFVERVGCRQCFDHGDKNPPMLCMACLRRHFEQHGHWPTDVPSYAYLQASQYDLGRRAVRGGIDCEIQQVVGIEAPGLGRCVGFNFVGWFPLDPESCHDLSRAILLEHGNREGCPVHDDRGMAVADRDCSVCQARAARSA